MQIEKLRLSHSTLSAFRECPRKLEFRKFFSHSKVREDTEATGAGKALHAGYQEWVKSHDIEKAIFAMMMSYPTEFNVSPNKDRSLEACYATLMNMVDSDQLSELELATVNCLDGKERPAIEVPFEISIRNFSLDDEKYIPVVYVGYVDLYMFARMQQAYKAVDIKTHRNNMSDMTPAYKFSDQVIPYGLVLEKMLGRPLDGFDISYISVYIDMLSPRTQLYEFHKSREDIEDWCKNLLVDLNEIKYFYQNQWFPRNGNSCLKGKYTCEFFDVCSLRTPESIQNYILQGSQPAVEKPFVPWITIELDMGL